LVVLLAAKTVPFDDGQERVVADGAADVVVLLVAVDDGAEPPELTVLFKTMPTTPLLETAALMVFFM